jgi:hypothetical protein
VMPTVMPPVMPGLCGRGGRGHGHCGSRHEGGDEHFHEFVPIELFSATDKCGGDDARRRPDDGGDAKAQPMRLWWR